jgi:CRISPR-associated endonuclease Csn1
MSKNFYIGLDVGTDSVGYAATDKDYNILRARGQDLWGSVLFDPANTAEERRANRTSRRRIARAHERLMLLQELFKDEIEKVDPTFFIRLNNSPLLMEDKDERLSSANVLFDDENYKDKDFFKDYPTIFHLRKSLLHGEIKDVRLLYLAVSHIIKNRGHFLFENQSFKVGDVSMAKEKFAEINNFLSERDMATLDLEKLDDVVEILKGKGSNRSKFEGLLAALNVSSKDKQQKAMVNALCGYKVTVKDLFCLDEDGEIKNFSFSDGAFDEDKLPKIEDEVGFDDAELVKYLKAIYDWSVLCSILGDHRYISEAKVEMFEKHREDLRWLKEYVRTNFDDAEYKKVFRRTKGVNNYAAYIGMDRKKGFSKCSKEDFYAFLTKELEITDESVLERIKNNDFLPKQISSANGVIPHQVHQIELEEILKNAEKYFSFLSKSDGKWTVSEKIISLLTFRIPYYVGPLNTTHGKFSWVQKFPGKERVKITPWNFAEVVDEDASEEQFISRMKSKCTYLIGEDVLPESSLLYSEFTFLNELNNLTVCGVKDARAKKLIYDYALTKKKVTLKACLAILIKNGIVPQGSKVDEVFSGTDGDFKTSLSPFVDLQFLGDKLWTNREMCEDIILWITLISSKSRLEKRIRSNYGKILTEEEIKRIKGLNYSKWGRLSKAFLDGIVSATDTDENGECLTIIRAMRLGNENLMQLLSQKHGFSTAIDDFNQSNAPTDKVTYKTVSELYCSPSVKRAIWQGVEIVREICKIQGGAPEKVFA